MGKVKQMREEVCNIVYHTIAINLPGRSHQLRLSFRMLCGVVGVCDCLRERERERELELGPCWWK